MIRFDVVKNGSVYPMAIDFEYHFGSDGRRSTVAILTDKTEKSIAVGMCTKDSRDSDVKEKSRKIALKKLLINVGAPKDIRTQIWNGYFSRSPKYTAFKASV